MAPRPTSTLRDLVAFIWHSFRNHLGKLLPGTLGFGLQGLSGCVCRINTVQVCVNGDPLKLCSAQLERYSSSISSRLISLASEMSLISYLHGFPNDFIFFLKNIKYFTMTLEDKKCILSPMT